jgi:acyl-CoA synthetase (AMP-forming)/AMP-acid ligase II
MTFAEVEERTNALAHSFRSIGIDEDSIVGILCRNHRGIIEATVACSQVGADILYLDPDAVPSALVDATWRRRPDVLIHDAELADRARELAPKARRVVASSEVTLCPGDLTLDGLAQGAADGVPKATRRNDVAFACEPGGRAASRKLPCSLITPGTVNPQLPLRRRDPVLLATAIATKWGFLNLMLGLRFASTVVLMRHFDPDAVLNMIDNERVAALAVSPEMLEEITDLHPCRSVCHDTGSLNVICIPGLYLPSTIGKPAIERFGNVLYNLRGPTIIKIGPDWWSRRSDEIWDRLSAEEQPRRLGRAVFTG